MIQISAELTFTGLFKCQEIIHLHIDLIFDVHIMI